MSKLIWYNTKKLKNKQLYIKNLKFHYINLTKLGRPND